MGRAPTAALADVVDDISSDDGLIRVAGKPPRALQPNAHVPGIGSLPLSERLPVRVRSMTNESSQEIDGRQLAVVAGTSTTCGATRPLDVFKWWYDAYVIGEGDGSLMVRYPSPVEFGNVNLSIHVDADGTYIYEFATYGVPDEQFSTLLEENPWPSPD
jgi:hypothetical protein